MDYTIIFAQEDIKRARRIAKYREARLAASEMRAGNYGKEREYWQAEYDRLSALIAEEESKR